MNRYIPPLSEPSSPTPPPDLTTSSPSRDEPRSLVVRLLFSSEQEAGLSVTSPVTQSLPGDLTGMHNEAAKLVRYLRGQRSLRSSFTLEIGIEAQSGGAASTAVAPAIRCEGPLDAGAAEQLEQQIAMHLIRHLTSSG